MKNLDRWSEGVSKQIVIRNEEGGMKASWKNNKVFFVGDGSEEEE
jgi:hypothetical protein